MSHIEPPKRVFPDGTPSPRYQILALSGGGFRGLFTAHILAELEKQSGKPLAESFDLIAGTSIGGILACGLSAKVPAETMAREFALAGQIIFPSKVFKRVRRVFAGAYDSEPLRSAITRIIGEVVANTLFSEMDGAIAVTAVNQTAWGPAIFRSKGLAGSKSDSLKTIDIAMATSAAPTYFHPQLLHHSNYVDGGLVANAPELVALIEAMKCSPLGIHEIHVLSIGTAGQRNGDQVRSLGNPGILGWLSKRNLVDLTLSANERLSIDQMKELLRDRYLRIDITPSDDQSQVIGIDKADGKAIATLTHLASEAIKGARTKNNAKLREFLSHQTDARMNK